MHRPSNGTDDHHHRLTQARCLQPTAGRVEVLDDYVGPGYGLPTDKDNNVYILEFSNTRIGRLDAKTKQAEIWSTPFLHSKPRRGRVDDQNRLWFAEYAGNGIGMFDPATQQIKEWKLPTPWSAPSRESRAAISTCARAAWRRRSRSTTRV